MRGDVFFPSVETLKRKERRVKWRLGEFEMQYGQTLLPAG